MQSIFFVFYLFLSISFYCQQIVKKKKPISDQEFLRTQKTLPKNRNCDGRVKPSQILGKMLAICDQQKIVSPMMGKPIEPGGSFPLQGLGFV